VLSAISWAIYGLNQKRLLRHLSSAQILFLVYTGATLVLLPTTALGTLFHVHRATVLALLFGVINTVVAYGAFAMALEVWEVSRVSSVAASAPLFTVAGSMLGARAALSWVTPETLTALSLAGALFVVAGSMVSALGSRRSVVPTRTS
jgi:drug/metabolite transporter (DMT)-like permease